MTGIRTQLDRLGVCLKSYAIGDHRSTCPKCSHLRKTIHQRTECLAVTIRPDAVLLYCHHCGWSGGAKTAELDEANRRRLEAQAARADKQRVERAIEIWSAALPIHGTAAEQYLVSARRVAAPIGDAVLRFHSSCPFKLDNDAMVRLPAMIGLFRDIITNKPLGIHRTALKPDGSGKADTPGLGNAKKMLGISKGAAIKLSPDADVTMGIGVAEGIETALTAFCAGWRPVWALGSASAIARFPVLSGVEAVTIFGDADEPGMKAAAQCQAQWRAAGREATIFLPPDAGQDFNDLARLA